MRIDNLIILPDSATVLVLRRNFASDEISFDQQPIQNFAALYAELYAATIDEGGYISITELPNFNPAQYQRGSAEGVQPNEATDAPTQKALLITEQSLSQSPGYINVNNNTGEIIACAVYDVRNANEITDGDASIVLTLKPYLSPDYEGQPFFAQLTEGSTGGPYRFTFIKDGGAIYTTEATPINSFGSFTNIYAGRIAQYDTVEIDVIV